MKKHHVFLPGSCCSPDAHGESIEITIHIVGYNFAPLRFFSSALSLVLFSVFSYLLCSSHYFTLPFLFCTMKFSFHTVCHLDMAYELCICLSPSLSTHLSLSCSSRPPFTNKVSVSITTSERQSEKIRYGL